MSDEHLARLRAKLIIEAATLQEIINQRPEPDDEYFAAILRLQTLHERVAAIDWSLAQENREG